MDRTSLPPAAASVPKALPYHFEVVFNPNEGTPPRDAIVVLMYEDDWDPDYQPPQWDDGDAGPGAGAIDVMGTLIDVLPDPIGRLVVPGQRLRVIV